MSTNQNSPVLELVEAADALARRSIVRMRPRYAGEPISTENCMYCQRSEHLGVLNHADGCKVGRVVRAIRAVRAVAALPKLGDGFFRAAVREHDAAVKAVPEDDLASPGGRDEAVLLADAGFRAALERALAGSDALHVGMEAIRAAVGVYDAAVQAAVLRETVQAHDAAVAAPPMESDESWEGSAAVLRAQATERRVVCGAHCLFTAQAAPALTCDKEPGHDADPLSDHWNRDARRSWPTAALIAEEAAQ